MSFDVFGQITSPSDVVRVVLYAVGMLFVAFIVAEVARGRGGSRSPISSTASRNRLLFAVVILLFAAVFKLVSSGLDVLVLLIALFGLGFGWSALFAEDR